MYVIAKAVHPTAVEATFVVERARVVEATALAVAARWADEAACAALSAGARWAAYAALAESTDLSRGSAAETDAARRGRGGHRQQESHRQRNTETPAAADQRWVAHPWNTDVIALERIDEHCLMPFTCWSKCTARADDAGPALFGSPSERAPMPSAGAEI